MKEVIDERLLSLIERIVENGFEGEAIEFLGNNWKQRSYDELLDFIYDWDL